MKNIAIVVLILLLSMSLEAQFLETLSLGGNSESLSGELISADFNNDGINEILRMGNGSWALWSNAEQVMNYSRVYRFTSDNYVLNVSSKAFDMNGDGLLDIVLGFVIPRDSATGLLIRNLDTSSGLDQNIPAFYNQEYEAGPGPPPGPPPVYYAQGVIQVHINLGNLNFAPPKRLAQNLGFLLDMEVANLNLDDEIEIVALSARPEEIDDLYTEFGICIGNFNDYQPSLLILSEHTFNDTLLSTVTVISDSTRTIKHIGLTDMNEDGFEDLIVASLPSGNIGIYNNLGNLSFALSDSLMISSGRIGDMRLIDLNHDDKEDLVYSGRLNEYFSHVSVGLSQDGNFSYPQLQIDSIENWLHRQIIFEDINDDEYPDYISRSTYAWEYKANLQDGTFDTSKIHLLDLYSTYFELHIADSNSINDFIQYGTVSASSNLSTAIYSFYNVDSSQELIYDIVSPNEFVFPEDFLVVDVNGDGAQEIIVASERNPVLSSIHLNIEDTLIQREILASNLYGARSVVSGDWDLDGDIDLAYSTFSGNSLMISYNESESQFRDTLILNSSLTSSPKLLSGDFDADGDIDLIMYPRGANNRPFIRLYRNGGDGNFSSFEELTDSVYYSSGDILFHDWDGDNYPDIFFQRSSILVYYRNLNGIGLASPDTLISACNNCNSFAFGDFNQDNLVDLYFKSNSAVHMVLLNQGEGAEFIADTLVTLNTGFSLVLVEDLNFDNTPDLLIANNDSLQLYGYLLGQAESGSFEQLGSFEERIGILEIADLNQDGLKDLYGRYQSSHEVFWLFRDPGGVLPFSKQPPESSIFAFPNPGSGQFQVMSAADNPIEKIEVLSMDGKFVKSIAFAPSSKVQFNLAGINGMYLVRAHTLKGIEHTTIVNSD